MTAPLAGMGKAISHRFWIQQSLHIIPFVIGGLMGCSSSAPANNVSGGNYASCGSTVTTGGNSEGSIFASGGSAIPTGGATKSGGTTNSGGNVATGGAVRTGGSASTGRTLGSSATSDAIRTCVAGGDCPTAGDTCKNASGAQCLCVGPLGASIITCDLPGGDGGSSGGIAATGGARTGGVTSTGGANTGGGGNGGVVGTGGTTPSTDNEGVACAGNAPWTAGNGDVQLTVDASAKGAAWNRFYERGVSSCHANTVLSTAWSRNIQPALKKGHDQAGFQYIRFHGILNGDIGVYQETNGTPTYNWTRFDQVYDGIVAAGMRPVFEVSFTPPPLASDTSSAASLHWYNRVPANKSKPKDWGKWETFMTEIVKHLQGRYGAAEVRDNWYFEVWNESSWMYSLGEGGYNELYSHTVKGLLAGDPQLRVGGPAASAASSPGQIRSLVSYTKSNNLKLSFVSYHRYANDAPQARADANAMLNFNKSLMATIKDTGFTGEIINDEWGASYDTHVVRDTEASASFIAKTVHLIGTDAATAPPTMFGYWTISDLYEEFDTGSALAYREGNYGLFLKGDASIPASFEVAKPAFNAFRLLHKMGNVRVSTTGGTTNDGVNATATISSDGSAVQVLVYNHATGGDADSTASSSVKLTVSNLPFAATSMKVRHYMVDRNHSNSYRSWVGMGKPQKPSAMQWSTLSSAAEICYYATTATLTGNSWTVTYPQNMYGVSLFILTK